MVKLELDTLNDCLDVVCAIYGKQRTEMMSEFYFETLSNLNSGLVVSAFKIAIDERYFPTPARIRELVKGELVDADWNEIVDVASGNKSSAEISGIAEIALKKIGGLKKVACADSKETIGLKAHFLKLLSIPPDPKALPPSRVTIKVGVQERGNDHEYPVDWDFSVRAASLIRLLESKEIKTGTARAMCSQFPQVKKAEVMAVVEEIEGKSGIEYPTSPKTSMSIDFAGIV